MRRLLIALCLSTPATLAQAASFDGQWVMEMTTEVGACEKSFQGTFKVADGQIVEADGAAPMGFVEANGAAWARFSRDGQLTRAQGKFAGAQASGAWSSNASYCGGRWRARKVTASR